MGGDKCNHNLDMTIGFNGMINKKMIIYKNTKKGAQEKEQMRFLKSIVNISYWLCSAVMIVIGIGIIILAFMNSPLQLQIALGLIGLGLIASGLVQVKRGQDRKINEERFDIIVTKLDEIQQELKKDDQPNVTGAIIADVISSGLKSYSEYITKQKKEEDNE